MYRGTRDSVTGSLRPPALFERSMSAISGVGRLELGRLIVAGSEMVAESEYRVMALAESGVSDHRYSINY